MPEEDPVTFERIKKRGRALFRNEELERELAAELRFHLESDTAQNLQSGMSAEEARLAALRSFGGVEQSKEECRDARRVKVVRELCQDVRYALRMLRKHPTFTAVSVITLALGIGANTAIFSVVSAVLLRPLSYPEPERLMQIGRSYSGNEVYPASEPKFMFWRDNNHSFEAMAATQGFGSGVNASGGSEPEYVEGIRVSSEFFRVLGVLPATGRIFTKEEDSPSGERVVILTDGLWRRRYAADEKMIGKTVTLNGVNHVVVGILPASFQYTSPADLFMPLRLNPASREGGHNLTVIGRLKRGVSQAQALAEMRLVGEKFRATFPRMMSDDESINLVSRQESLVQSIRLSLLILLGAVAFLLLIACANVANLQLTRAAARQKEMAIRLALGAGWWRVVRQLLAEGMVLALIGGAAGLLFALWGVRSLMALIPPGMVPRLDELSFDWRVLVFTLSLAILTGIVFGLAPVLQARLVDVSHALKQGSSRSSVGAVHNRLRNTLVVTEVAVTLMLLIGAALLVRTFANLRGVGPGFDSRNVLTFQVALSGPQYDTTAKVTEFNRRALEGFASLPGVEATAVTSSLPLLGQFNLPYAFPGDAEPKGAVQYRMISPDYFRVMKVALRQGRAFSASDTAGSAAVVIVNEAFARQNFPNAEPIGQQLCVGCSYGDPAMRSVVGVVSDTKQSSLSTPAPPMVFVLFAQVPDALNVRLKQFVATNFVIRTIGDPMQLAASARQEVQRLDAALPVRNVRPMEEVLSRSIAQERFNVSLLGLFATIGLILAAIGIYGVMSYAVTQRTHEFGLRIALGAQMKDVLRLVIGNGMTLALIGVAIGLAGAFALTRLMTSLLFGVTPIDAPTFVTVSILLLAVALVACYIPARRAMKVNPLIALRYE
jgi:predicted permease